MNEIVITTEYIKLDQLLKFSGVCFDGVEAKEFIKEGLVKVNGETELRRGRKIYRDYIIEIDNGDSFISLKVV